MPARNGMGPQGQGPMTGRGLGRCGGANAGAAGRPGGPGIGRGRGGGQGGGWRHRRGYQATGTPTPVVPREAELAVLKQQAESLDQALGDLKARIREFDEPAPDAAGKAPR